MFLDRTQQAGASFIEVLIAMLILGVGMLAYAGLHSSSLQTAKMAQYRTIATQLANDFGDRMRANAQQAGANNNYQYLVQYAPLANAIAEPACALDPCTAAEIATLDMIRWRNLARTALPGGSLYTQIDATVPANFGQLRDFWVMWRDPNTGDEAQIGSDCPAPAAAPATVRCMHFRLTL